MDLLFAILQKYDFSSKSQPNVHKTLLDQCCLRYCKSTIFQANHNRPAAAPWPRCVVCDTAKVRFFKQITTQTSGTTNPNVLFAILQKYDFSSKSQPSKTRLTHSKCCLRYCKSTIFQANHNQTRVRAGLVSVVCDTAKVRFFKQITTRKRTYSCYFALFAILQKYDFSSKSQLIITI